MHKVTDRPRAAVILAAGYGSRMGSLTATQPKCLLEVGGRSLIEAQVGSLERFGVHDITIVVGYQGDRIRERLKNRVSYVENRRYRETNSLYSLWLARHRLADGGLVLNADVWAPASLIRRLLQSPAEDAALIDCGHELGAEEMKVKLSNDRIVGFGKQLCPAEAGCENVGILKFGRESGQRLADVLDQFVRTGHENAWAPLAFAEIARERRLWAVPTGGVPWTEIDFPDDLERARRLVAPGAALGFRRVADAATL
ncbi:MAG: phosphocholine cytidylyltransferase family protein [Acidobacteria bacterium]|nr:phosphocholine cytidylyltransferase family protein [Acidobacteriota bacterium]